MTGEATDLVARLNNAWVETVSPSPEGFRRSMVANVLNEARAAIQAHATLIEAQAAEIEGFKAWVSDALAVLTTIAGAETPPQQHGHYLAHRTAVKAARAFLASRTERADV